MEEESFMELKKIPEDERAVLKSHYEDEIEDMEHGIRERKERLDAVSDLDQISTWIEEVEKRLETYKARLTTMEKLKKP
jgi:FMN phosphatase YigB (HAD superfamily)